MRNREYHFSTQLAQHIKKKSPKNINPKQNKTKKPIKTKSPKTQTQHGSVENRHCHLLLRLFLVYLVKTLFLFSLFFLFSAISETSERLVKVKLLRLPIIFKQIWDGFYLYFLFSQIHLLGIPIEPFFFFLKKHNACLLLSPFN